MIDIQKQEDNRKDIDRVGVKDISMPFVVADRDNQVQNTVAKVSLSVGLPKREKGTHMSRFVEILEEYVVGKKISMNDFESLLEEIKSKLAELDEFIAALPAGGCKIKK